jgi:ATP-dependent helicase/DNAse subunit B
LQKILNSEVNIEQGKKYIDIKNNNLKLFGYSTDDVSLLERFDTTYENSEYISGMKYGKNGFYKYSKILTNTEMENFIKLVDKKIEAARDSILECDFSINPKKLNTDKDITGCKFCHYKDICFRKNEDIINIIKETDLSFLKEVSE